MALENENGMVMPVAPMYSGFGGGNSGFGGWGGDGWWIILLFILLGNNGWGGFGGFGGMGGSYARGGRGGSRGYSSARGRGRNARRDSMGRYSSRDGYSMADADMTEMIDEMRSMMDELPEEKKMEVRKFISKMESM